MESDEDLKRHLAEIPTPRMAMLMHAYSDELSRRACWLPKMRTSDLKHQEQALRVVMAAAISRQSVLLIGPPKCGKTMLKHLTNASRSDVVIDEVREGECVKTRFDGAVSMQPVELDDLIFGESRYVPEGVIWAKSHWASILDIDPLALDWLTSVNMQPADVERVLRWARALAALDRSRPANISHVREAVSIVELAIGALCRN